MPLPQGYVLDSPASGPPSGYTLDQSPAEQSGFARSYWDQINPMQMVQGMANAVRHPIDTIKGIGAQNQQLFDKAKDDLSKGNYIDAARHGLGYAANFVAPGVGSTLDAAGDQAAQGNYGGSAGTTLGLATALLGPKVVPAVGRVTGGLLKSAAVPIAESAMGIPAMARAYGKTPGAAALEETSGFRPAAVADSARNRMGLLNTELDQRAAASTTPASLQPARDVIDQRMQTAASGNSSGAAAELGPMRAQLTQPGPGFAGIIDPATGEIAADQSASNILRMKREFGKDFTKWNPLHPKGETGTARQAYHALDSELDRTVPGADTLNQRISSLIPVAERGEKQDLNAGITQNVMHRVAAHTGSLIGAGAGYAAGGPMGAVAGLVLPEVVSSPAVRMAAARGIYGAGGLLQNTAAQRAAQAALLSGGLLGIQKKGLLY